MADKENNTQQSAEEIKDSSNSESSEATVTSPEQQQQQENQQNKDDNGSETGEKNDAKEPATKTTANQTMSNQTTVSETVSNAVNLGAIISSITVPSDLIQQPPVNGSMSEEEHQRMVSKLSAYPDIPSAPTQHATAVRCTAGEMEVAELRVKIICQEKNIMALKMELKAAELQVEAKNKVDAKKTRLIELLDNKLKTVEARNTKLMDMLEEMLKDKDSSTNRLKEATANMTDLSQRLLRSEKMKSELVNANTELRSMLESLETKGTQIAKLAVEKVLKYKDANDQMQQELSDLKDEAAAAAAKPTDSSSTAVKPSDSSAAAARASTQQQNAAACEQLWATITELQQQIATILQKVQAGATVEHLQQTIQEASEANTALGVNVEAARQKTGEGLTALGVENDQLRALVDDFDESRREMARKDELSQDLIKEQKESVSAKDKEIEDLKEELKSLKNAIGHLIGASK